jgi:DNA-binding response OmpR family regulator
MFMKKKILVVDDETDILKILRDFLEIEGYTVFTAQNAQETMRMLSQEVFMVMFLDLKLPGMNGIELCKRIRRDNLVAVIYAITGYTNYYGLMDCRAAGFDDFFIKPLDFKILQRAAKDAFEKIERWKVDEYDLM